MNLQTFTAATMLECLAQVKATMGPNAVILHTRSYSRRFWLGLRRRELVEITAGKGIGQSERRRATAHPVSISPAGVMPFRVPTASPQISAYVEAPASRAVSMAPPIPAVPTPMPGRALLDTPVVSGVLTSQVAKDVDELKKLVGDLVDTMHKKEAPNVPEELYDYYMKLVQNQVAPNLAVEIVQTLRKQLRPEHIANDQFVKEKIAEQIARLIPTAGPLARKKSEGPHIAALIGPTGVGKTTTIAKLSANIKLHEKKRVGLITLDTYRLAAADQLGRYADILGSNLRVVNSAREMREAIAAMAECEFILIDTAGRSPRDPLKISELKTLLDVANPDEVHLVLSTTASQGCIELAIERFGAVQFDKLIFTKLDEASGVGVVLNVINRLHKALSYVTTGQNVPNDIEVGEGRRLARLILEGGA